MQALKYALSVCFTILLAGHLMAQHGMVRGIVYDDKTVETIPGVTVLAEGTTRGAITDLDGNFNLPLPEGTYTLRISFVSYETLFIEDLVVTGEEVTFFDNLRLKEANIELDEVVVSAQMIRNTETAMLSMKKKSASLMDGISAASLRKIGDSDAASSMKRVPGVSVQGGKYVFVRGLGDRYTKTILNGMDIPGLDPDRNTLQMDIFPTNVVDNIIVLKTFTADMPADFTGGIINITSKDFPEQKTAKVSLSLGYIPGMHFNSDYLSYQGGKTDWLGFDDGTRQIPATENIPLFSEVVANPDGPQGQRYREILASFNPTLAAMQERSLMDFSIGASAGNQINRNKVSWGYNASLSYKNETDYYKDVTYGRYGLSSQKDVYEMESRELQVGDYGLSNVLISGMAGLALKTNKSKYRLSLLHLQNGESKAGIFDYQKSNQGTEFNGFQHNLEYSQRSLTNIMFGGKHFINKFWEVEWNFSPTLSRMEDPDIRFTRYKVNDEDGSFVMGTESGFPERIWRNLEEVNYSGVLHAIKRLKFRGEDARLLFGGVYTYKARDFAIWNYNLNIRNVPLTGDPNELFFPENLWPKDGSVSRGTTYEAPFVPVNPNQFNANTTNRAAYLSSEFSPINHLKAIVGVRVEQFSQYYNGQDQLGTYILDNEKVLDNVDFFPSVNFIYSINKDQNLRFSFASTIARPSFKELSFAEISDPITGRMFVGGLFRDANDVAGIEYWDGNLVSTHIQNFDLRWETFQPAGQTFSLSAFYKRFNNPIEMVQYVTLVGAFQPRNVGDGEVFGGEMELRKNLDFIGNAWQNFSFNTNFTLTKSRIKLSATEYQSRLDNARLGQSVDQYRDMAGQAPWLINAGLAYNGGQRGFFEGFEAGVYYNVQGQTLAIVGIVDRPDIYSVPFHSLNLNINKSFGKDKRMQLGVKVENILADKTESIFKSYLAADQYFTRLDPGTKFTLRFGYSIF
ncbi:MAG: TonB-dependent receptor [Clostridia bacterium]|nr:TonB-dependent receptor [Clostridia bacterium]